MRLSSRSSLPRRSPRLSPGWPQTIQLKRRHAPHPRRGGCRHVLTRSRGLMSLASPCAPNAGMVFVFDEASQHCMWMKNTLYPSCPSRSSTNKGTIINIEDMAPQTEDTHCAKKAGALCAGDGPRLVRQPRHQARHQARRHGKAPPLTTRGAWSAAPRLLTISWRTSPISRARDAGAPSQGSVRGQ